MTARPGKRGDALRLSDMIEAADRLEQIRAAGHERFLADTILQDAAIRRLEVVGEAAGNVSKEARERYPNVPWQKMRGFASLVKHEYWRVDAERVWRAVEAMPAIRRSLSTVRVDDSVERGGRRE